ncbi:MAG: hypothetical protein MJA82_10005 [Clostridia bacterium]|nr:hypothetical protein [Clostridia bacterium]
MNIPITTAEELFWEDLEITIVFKNILKDDKFNELEDLIMSWYTLGVNYGFQGTLHNMSKVWIEDNEVGFTVDMGSVEVEICLGILFASIEGFSKVNNIEVQNIILGNSEGL